MSAIRPGRRGALAMLGLAGAGLPLGAAAAASAEPDAELIRLCAEYERLEIRLFEILDGPDAIEDGEAAECAARPYLQAQRRLLPTILMLRAATPAGLLARIRCLAAEEPGMLRDEAERGVGDRMLQALLRDGLLLRAAGGPA